MKTIIPTSKYGKPRFNPGGLLSTTDPLPKLDSITDARGITWTGPVVAGRLDLESAHYRDALMALRESIYPRKP